MTDQEHVAAIRAAAMNLNDAIAAAVMAGMDVDVSVIKNSQVAPFGDWPRVIGRVTRKTTDAKF